MSKFKEEAVIVTKAETTAQSSTGMSSHSIIAIVYGASYMSTATWKLRGVEVCGEMTVVVYSSHDQQITWPGYGLRLNIPKGCLPAGMEQCTINIKASLAGQYEFPENSHLVSAVFWLHCEDVHKFTRLITVDIQHCAKSENVANPLHFIRAVCSQKQLPYTFKLLPGGSFATHSSYGVIELNSFSGVGITQEGSEDREYCLRLFYRGQPNLCKIDFVVTWNIEAYRTVRLGFVVLYTLFTSFGRWWKIFMRRKGLLLVLSSLWSLKVTVSLWIFPKMAWLSRAGRSCH